MRGIDWVVLGIVALLALLGARQGLVAGALSLAGLVVGAILGGRLAPALLSGGSRSPYAPLVAAGGAIALASVVQGLGLRFGLFLRRSVLRLPVLSGLDTVGGLLLGAAAGIVAAWVLGVVALQLPGQPKLRHEVQRSALLRRLNEILPSAILLRALARFDPFSRIAGPLAPVQPPDPAVLRLPGVRAAAPSVVRVVGTACGLGIEGSGWVAAPGVVVTAAHVVAGQRDTSVQTLGSSRRLSAEAVAFDPRNDVAVLRVPGLRTRPLRLVDPKPGSAAAVLGYPNDGPFDAAPARIGPTVFVLTQDAYGRGPVGRTVTTLRGVVRHGNSGGPAVDSTGAVETTVFAARVGGGGAFGVPSSIVRKALASLKGPVSTDGCVR
ncbi:MAG: MarP family serine protease [Actinomycetota bacterium]|nr:MarP family serine protease [Actinomycetota bacterium]